MDRKRRRALLVATLASLAVTWCVGAVVFRNHTAVQPVLIAPIGCDEVAALIERMEHDEASADEVRSLRAHLRCCGTCRQDHSCCGPSYERAFCQ